MKAKVKFVYVDDRLTRRTKVIEIEMPDFTEIVFPDINPMTGEHLKETVNDQIINYLDETDKTDLMIKHDMYQIVDYHIHTPQKRLSEKESFLMYLQTATRVVGFDEQMVIDMIAYANKSATIFGKRKSNHQKLSEILDGVNLGQQMIITAFDAALRNIDEALAVAQPKWLESQKKRCFPDYQFGL